MKSTFEYFIVLALFIIISSSIISSSSSSSISIITIIIIIIIINSSWTKTSTPRLCAVQQDHSFRAQNNFRTVAGYVDQPK